MARIVLLIAPERFRDEELFDTKRELDQAGHQTVVASTRKGYCPGSRGGKARATLLLSEVNPSDYDAVVFVGGGGSKVYFEDQVAQGLAKEMHERGKVVAAICLAPVVLANAGVLKGKDATVAGTEAKTIEGKGATYMGPGVVVAGNVVTANAPKASKLFGQKINEVLESRERQPKIQD
jgi:protease I